MSLNNEDPLSSPSHAADVPPIELFDNRKSLGFVTMTGPLSWTKQVSGLTEGTHTLTAEVQGGAPVSSPWSISVGVVTGEENFEDFETGNILVGTSVTGEKMTLTFVRGRGTLFISQLQHYPPHMDGQVVSLLSVDDDFLARMDLKGSCSSVRFWVVGQESGGVGEVRFYNRQNQLLGNSPFSASYGEAKEIVFSAPAIIRIDLSLTWGGSAIFLDHVVFG